MEFVFPTPCGANPETFRAATPSEIAAMEIAAAGVTSSPEVNAMLAEISRLRLWVACSCRTSGKPLMASMARRDGSYRLVRLPERAPHENTCGFRTLPAPRELFEAPSQLASVLQNLLTAAKVNQFVLHPSEESTILAEQVSAIAKAAQELRIEERIRLSRYLVMGEDQISSLSKKLANTKDRFATGPWGIALLPAEAISNRTVRMKDGLVYIGETPIEHLGIPSEVGPFLVAIRYNLVDGEHSTVGVAAQPVLSLRNLFPVSGDMERLTLKRMLRVQKSVDLAGAFRILKPLQPEFVARGGSFLVSKMMSSGQFAAPIEIYAVDTRNTPSFDWRMPESEETPVMHDVYGDHELRFADALAERMSRRPAHAIKKWDLAHQTGSQ